MLRIFGRKSIVITSIAAVMLVGVACGSGNQESLFSSEPVASDAQWIIATDKTYSLDDLKAVGWKARKDLVLDYPGSTAARWGFLSGKEVGVLLYPTAEEARTAGLKAAREQTAVDEEGHAAGVIDRISCRSAQGQSAVEHREPSSAKPGGLGSYVPSSGSEIFSRNPGLNAAPCPNKFPTYSEFRIIGNMVVMCESDGRKVSGPSATCEKLPGQLGA